MAKVYTRPTKAPEAHRKYTDKVRKAETRGTKMPKMGRREMLVLWFEHKGYRVVPGRSSKFVTMEKPGVEMKYFIGKKGSLLHGKNISSVGLALTDMIKWAALETWANKQRG
jgi:hypothetical protein